MGVYNLELEMDPLQPASCPLTLVQDVGFISAGNLCHLSGTHPNTQDCVEPYATKKFLARQLRPHLFAKN
jgi:hypothetical protein